MPFSVHDDQRVAPGIRMPIDTFVSDVEALDVAVEEFPQPVPGKVFLGVSVRGEVSECWHAGRAGYR